MSREYYIKVARKLARIRYGEDFDSLRPINKKMELVKEVMAYIEIEQAIKEVNEETNKVTKNQPSNSRGKKPPNL